MAKTMKTVVIKKSRWLTQGGKTQTDSSLYSSKSKRMCCLGFAAQQAGCTGLTDLSFPSRLPIDQYDKFRKTYPKLSPFVDQLVDINDSTTSTRAEKAAMIAEIGRKGGVNFVFVP